VGIGVGVEEVQMLAWSDDLSIGGVRCRSAERESEELRSQEMWFPSSPSVESVRQGNR
jgi:hypothetical protein